MKLKIILISETKKNCRPLAMKKSPYHFHFPVKYHPVTFKNCTLPDFSKTRPKYIRSLELINIEPELLRPLGRNLKHLKYVYSVKSVSNDYYSQRKIVRLPLSCLKTTKHAQIIDNSKSSYAGNLETRYLWNLKSYSLGLVYAKALRSLKSLRKTETIKIIFNGTYGMYLEGELWKEGKYLKRLMTKNVIMELVKASPSEMTKLAKIIPKSASLHFVFENLPLNFKVNEYDVKLAERIRSLILRNLTNNSFFSVIQSTKFLKNLSCLHLGKNFFEGVLELNKTTNYSLFAKLGDFKELKSLKLNFKLTNSFYTEVDVSRFFQKIILPAGLEIFSLDLDGVMLDETSRFLVQNFGNIFKQIENMNELKALRLYFGSHVSSTNACDEFLSLFPCGFPQLENLSIETRFYFKNHQYSMDRVFDWVQSFPKVKHACLEIPLMSYFEGEKTFDYEIKNLESLILNISHEDFGEERNYFEEFLAFLARKEGLKILKLHFEKSFNYIKTMQMLNKHLCKMRDLEDLALAFNDFEGIDFENLCLLKPLVKKVRSFCLIMIDGYRMDGYDKLGKIARKEFADEIKKKGNGFDVSLNNVKLA